MLVMANLLEDTFVTSFVVDDLVISQDNFALGVNGIKIPDSLVPEFATLALQANSIIYSAVTVPSSGSSIEGTNLE
jgi:hypothetical protein